MRDRILQPLMNLTFPDMKCTNLQAVRICKLSIYYHNIVFCGMFLGYVWKLTLSREI